MLPAVYFRQAVDGSFEYLGGAVEPLLGIGRKELLAEVLEIFRPVKNMGHTEGLSENN